MTAWRVGLYLVLTKPGHGSVDAKQEVERYLDAPQPKSAKKWADQLTSHVFQALFIKYNTPIPSSAATERMFSVGKDVLRPKRCAMSDEHFEQAMFLRLNWNLLGKSEPS